MLRSVDVVTDGLVAQRVGDGGQTASEIEFDRRASGALCRPARLCFVDGMEIRREVPAGKLGGRPPEGPVPGCRLAATTRGVATQPLAASPGQQNSPQHRMEWPRLDVGPGKGRDGLCRGVGLLSGQAALLERERDRIASGPGALRARHPPVAIDSDESEPVGRQPGSGLPSAIGPTPAR